MIRKLHHLRKNTNQLNIHIKKEVKYTISYIKHEEIIF